jgi:hypothetical protein
MRKELTHITNYLVIVENSTVIAHLPLNGAIPIKDVLLLPELTSTSIPHAFDIEIEPCVIGHTGDYNIFGETFKTILVEDNLILAGLYI